MSSSTTARSGSQNNSERPSSSRTSTAACSELPPARLDRAVHPGKLGFPVPFPHPHHCASTSFVRFHEVHLCLLLVGDRATPSPSFRRFTVRSAPPSFSVRGTSKAQRFHPQTARPSPSTQDVRTFSLQCRCVLPRAGWLHRALPPKYRYAPHTNPRRSPPCRSRLEAGPYLRPQALSFPVSKANRYGRKML